MAFILGRKLEMSQYFDENGAVTPVTLVKAEPNIVTQVRTEEKDGYVGVQLGTDVTSKPLNKPTAGHIKELPSVKTLREFRVDSTEMNRGDQVDVSVFEPGMKVDVIGESKGRGFQGVVKRHGFKGGPASHGHKDQQRMPGSLGSKRQGPVQKGKRMGGRMGADRVTVKNLVVVSIDKENNILAIKGAVPGARGGLLMIRARNAKHVWQK